MTDELTLDELRVALLEYMQAFLSGDTDAHIKVHEFEQAVRRDERAAPCQHYWLQYMTNPVQEDELDDHGYVEPFLQPDGFYCVHCRERAE